MRGLPCGCLEAQIYQHSVISGISIQQITIAIFCQVLQSLSLCIYNLYFAKDFRGPYVDF
jgi:hypothetical protein